MGFATTDPAGTPAARTVAFTVTDSAGAASDPATRAVDVATSVPPPTVVSHSYQAVGNTPLAVGTTVPGPAASIKGSLLSGDGDADPGAALSVTGSTSPAHGAVLVNQDGTFTYTPDAGYSGPDSFSYTVDGDNAPSQTATAAVTVSVGPVVWYVDNSEAGAGTGQGSTPFAALAAATAAAGPGDIIFLYQGSGPYGGGVDLQAGQDLYGQPNGLTVDGEPLLAPVGSTPVISGGAGDGIDLAQGSDVEGVNVAGASGSGIAARGVGDATVGTSTPVAVSGAGADGIHVSGGSGTLDFGQTSVTGSAGHSVQVTGRTGGTVAVGGAVTDHSGGIALAGNAGAAINFSGTLTFQSVTSPGAASGIVLTSTGTAGGLAVTGAGAAGTGGTIAGSTGPGIALSSSAGPSFTDMIIKNNEGGGITGAQVTGGLTLASSTVSGNGTPVAVSGQNNDGLDFSAGLTGPVSITNSVITGSADNNAVITDSSGTLGLTVAGSTFSTSSAGSGNDGLQVNADGTTDATVSVTGSTFTDNTGSAFAFATDATSAGTDRVTFTRNTLNSVAASVLGGGVAISPSGGAQTTIAVDDNAIQNAVADSIGIDEAGAGTLGGTIHGNAIGSPAVQDSGGAEGIDVTAGGTSTQTLTISGNNLRQYYAEAGIHFLDGDGNPAMNLTVTGNTVTDPGSLGSWGIFGEDGVRPADAGLACAAISGNSVSGAAQPAGAGFDIELDQGFATTLRLPGYTGGSGGTSAVRDFLAGGNEGNGTPSTFALASPDGGGFAGGSC